MTKWFQACSVLDTASWHNVVIININQLKVEYLLNLVWKQKLVKIQTIENNRWEHLLVIHDATAPESAAQREQTGW